jgi:hypothetical protein
MADSNKPGIYLMVDFDWPKPVEPEYGQFAKRYDSVRVRSSSVHENML